MQQQDNKNILIATFLSAVVLLSWTWFYEKPKLEQREEQRKIFSEQQKLQQKQNPTAIVGDNSKAEATTTSLLERQVITTKMRDESLKETANQRVKILNNELHGSISLKGARFDDITLAKYFTTTQKKDEVVLLAPSDSKERYFADFGWISSDQALELPKPDSLWHASSNQLTPQNPLTLSWKNSAGIEFFITIKLDENYMFEVEQSVKNNSKQEIVIANYGRINRSLNHFDKSIYILHEGPIGVFKDGLQEVSYSDITKEKKINFDSLQSSEESGWLGISDKYWISSIIPDKNMVYQATFTHNFSNQNHLFNVELVGQQQAIKPSEEVKFTHHFFAGAKKVSLLDQYSKNYDIKLFDRAIDFGWFYFLTKPFFFMLQFIYKIVGNFGLAIIAMTVLVKLLLFPIANKSYVSISLMKALQPKIEAIREKFKSDRVAMNREMMALYKKEKINPASGCLPVLIQIPVFFALYKVLYVTLDMRQAPFYGWIHDLSAADPTSIFNLFGLLPYQVSTTFTIGIWPLLMGLTMILQQKLSPMSTDPVQAKVLKFMPYVMTFLLAAFPAGLVIYWTWSNALSILQQWVITKKINKDKPQLHSKK